MNNQVMIEEIDWSRIPTVAELAEARACMTFQACRGLAYNTLDAYGRNLERYLFFLRQTGVQPWDVKQDQVALYLHDLLAISVTPEKESRLANATIQQHLTTVRLFHEYLLEEERCKRNVFKQGSGFSSRPLIRREHKLPWIPTDEDWCRVLAVAAKEPIRNRLMLAMNYDGGLRREELCSLETGDIDPSRRVIRIRSETTKNRRTRVLPYSAITAALRGFHRFLATEGKLPAALNLQIDTPRLYRLEKLPRALPWKVVAKLLSSMETATSMGSRDYTMFVLIAIYGLRASEVIAIELDDIRWRQGILRIHQRKTPSPLELPLTNEATSALVKHLKRTPPPTPYRKVFMRMRAPHWCVETNCRH